MWSTSIYPGQVSCFVFEISVFFCVYFGFWRECVLLHLDPQGTFICTSILCGNTIFCSLLGSLIPCLTQLPPTHFSGVWLTSPFSSWYKLCIPLRFWPWLSCVPVWDSFLYARGSQSWLQIRITWRVSKTLMLRQPPDQLNQTLWQCSLNIRIFFFFLIFSRWF